MFYVNLFVSAAGYCDYVIADSRLAGAQVVYIGHSFAECEQAIQWELDS